MAVKTYGAIVLQGDKWVIERADPHVCIKLKSIFPKIPKTKIVPFIVDNTPEICLDLLWFMDRYPLLISDIDLSVMLTGRSVHIERANYLEDLLLPDYTPTPAYLKPPEKARHYQVVGRDVNMGCNRLLLGDDLGLGKTVSAILMLLEQKNRPAFVVCPVHLVKHWKAKIAQFTDLSVHEIKTRKIYNLPVADVYIIRYTTLQGWVDVFREGLAKYVIFDEIQDLRHSGTSKYQSAKILSEKADRCTGLSATPIYNYGDEIYNVLNIVKPGCLGDEYDFLREWAGDSYGRKVIIKNPQALGTYLRDNFLFLRRTREEVGLELPRINTIIQNVDYDEESVKKFEEIAKVLAIKVTQGSFMERGQAARELDMLARQSTGVAKAKGVAAFVRMLLESGEAVLLGGWHRQVYDIWYEELKEFNPVFYTGAESAKQKSETETRFISGETNLMIMSLRSGVGVDGLQNRCSTVIYGEFDWSPKVHDQFTGRIDRPGQANPVTVYFLTSDTGSDPLIIDLLGLKASQSAAIVDPLKAQSDQYSDESRIKLLARQYLDNKEPEQIELFNTI